MMFDRRTHWQKIYQEKSTLDVSWYQKEPNLSLEFVRSAKVATNDPIIDVGCGVSVLVDYLIKECYTNLAVLDISANALASTKNRLGDSANNIDWFVAHITQFDAPNKFSLWHDRAVFHFLTDHRDRKNYVKVLKNSLRTEGHLIIAAFAIGGPEKCSGLEIVQYDSEKMMAELGEDFELVEERKEVHITPANKEQEFIFFHFLKVPKIK